jgi:5'-3' exonuclease
MYKFMANEKLLENMQKMLDVFSKNRITPVFIFDGKPPEEKRDLLKRRQMAKYMAEKKYNELKAITEGDEMTEDQKETAMKEMQTLKQKFIRIREADIANVKELFRQTSTVFYEAKGEADKMCADMVRDDKAWACISDDMDMFVYGCNRVFRNVNIYNSTMFVYDTKQILYDLMWTQKEMRDILILSGTDYSVVDKTISLDRTVTWFVEYKKYIRNNHNKNCRDFYTWLCKHTGYIKDYDGLMKTYSLFVDSSPLAPGPSPPPLPPHIIDAI